MPCPPISTIIISGHARMNAYGRTDASGRPAQTSTTATRAPCDNHLPGFLHFPDSPGQGLLKEWATSRRTLGGCT